MVLAHLVSGVVGSGLRALLVLALEVSKVPSTQNTPKERIMAREAVIVGSVRTGLTKAHRGSFNMTEPVDYTAHVLKGGSTNGSG